MKQTDELPFKRKDKFVVERYVPGNKTYFWKENGEAVFEPECEVDKRVARVINDNQFVLEGRVVDDRLFVSDLLYYDGKDLSSKSWSYRYKILRDEFRWNSSVTINRPIVVTNREEMKEAMKLFDLLDYSEGVLIRDYESTYDDDKIKLQHGGFE